MHLTRSLTTPHTIASDSEHAVTAPPFAIAAAAAAV